MDATTVLRSALVFVVAGVAEIGGGYLVWAYGGVFVVLSLVWGWVVDRVRPDVPDVVGGLVCLGGVAIIMYWPRA